MKAKKTKVRALRPARGLTHATLKRLLAPVAVLVRAGGVTPVAARRAFAEALQSVAKTSIPRRLEKIGYSTAYANIVTTWTRDPRFLDQHGRPRLLPIRGRNSFSSLVRVAAPGARVQDALDVLERYGNIDQTSHTGIRLIRTYFFAANDQALALEPMAYFLADAGSTFEKILARPPKSKAPKFFWRKVEVDSLSPKAAVQFQKFMQHRTLTFLEEVDDWLAAHATSSKRRNAGRVGMGLFTFQQSNDKA